MFLGSKWKLSIQSSLQVKVPVNSSCVLISLRFIFYFLFSVGGCGVRVRRYEMLLNDLSETMDNKVAYNQFVIINLSLGLLSVLCLPLSLRSSINFFLWQHL